MIGAAISTVGITAPTTRWGDMSPDSSLAASVRGQFRDSFMIEVFLFEGPAAWNGIGVRFYTLSYNVDL